MKFQQIEFVPNTRIQIRWNSHYKIYEHSLFLIINIDFSHTFQDEFDAFIKNEWDKIKFILFRNISMKTYTESNILYYACLVRFCMWL